MSVQDMTIQLDEEDAFHYIVRYLREGRSGPYSSYGYGYYLPNVMREYLASVSGAHPSDTDRYLIRDAQRIIEGIESLVRLHNAQEEDIYEHAGVPRTR